MSLELDFKTLSEFLEEHSDKWELEHRFTHNNGFTIIKRK